MGPRTCPTSIMVLKKPIDVPTKLRGVKSHISGAVEEITMAKPNPYPIEIASKQRKLHGEWNKKQQYAAYDASHDMGMLLLLLSEKRPIIGRETIKETICTPMTTETASALKPAT